MTKEATDTIIFPTLSAATLFEHEITGQLSDGAWENAAPYDHWKFWCRLNVEFRKGETARVETDSPYLCLKTGYNIATLYEYIVDRMLAKGRIARAAEAIGMTKLTRELADASEYMPETMADWCALISSRGGHQVSTPQGVSSYTFGKVAAVPYELAESYFKTSYQMKDLRADVKLIKQAMKTVKR